MSIVDVSGKPLLVRRDTHVTALVKLCVDQSSLAPIRDRVYRLYDSSCRLAWAILPLLHPLQIGETNIKLELHGDILRIDAQARTIYRTGVEMDTLTGVAAVVSALPHYLRAPVELLSMKVEKKIKSFEEKLESQRIDTSNIVDIKGAVELEDPQRSLIELRGVGTIKLKPETVERILRGGVEKGNVVEFSRACMLRNMKILPLLLAQSEGCCKVPLLQGAGTEVFAEDDYVQVSIWARFLSASPWLCYSCTLFSLLSGLLSVWDMVKKYEKDESGQYPVTEIRSVRVTVESGQPF